MALESCSFSGSGSALSEVLVAGMILSIFESAESGVGRDWWWWWPRGDLEL